MNASPEFAPAPVIEETARLVAEYYVFPELGEQLATLLRTRLAAAAYDVQNPEELAELATADLQSINGDQHLRLIHHPTRISEKQGDDPLSAIRRTFDESLGGVRRIEQLGGGVAVLDLGPLLFPLDWAAEPLAAALNLVAPAQALILDLRACRGGDPRTVAFVCGYLLDESTHLNSMHWRGDDEGRNGEQSWSQPYVPGARFGGSKPLYVLTGAATFSGGEELAYDLQQLGRASAIVGEVTRGGANPRRGWTVHPHLEATVPTGRAVNPVTGTNWEGTGVQPDVPCAAEDALKRAHELASEQTRAPSEADAPAQ